MGIDSARVLMEVVAGIIPDQPEPEFTKRFAITSDEWHATGKDEQMTLLMERYSEAQEYARSLVNPFGVAGPNRVNWVRVDWLWL